MILDTFQRVPLTFGPSPIQRLDRLTNHLGGAQVWAKREDVSSGLAFGGNKVRKLEYLAADALAQGADTLVSIGGVRSNHTRQVAATAAHLGLGCVLVQESWVDWPDAVYDRVGNIQLSPRCSGRRIRAQGVSGLRVGDRARGPVTGRRARAGRGAADHARPRSRSCCGAPRGSRPSAAASSTPCLPGGWRG